MDTLLETVGSQISNTSPTTWIFFLAILLSVILFRRLRR